MPQLKISTPEPLEDLCLTAVMRCLETDLVLCEIANSLAPTSLLLRRIDINRTQIGNELSDYMSILPGTLSEMVRQKLTTRVIKKYTDNSNSQFKETSPFHNLPLHAMTIHLLEVILNEDVHGFDLAGLEPSSHSKSLRPAAGDPELWELVLNRCPGLQKFSLPSSISTTFGTNLNSFVTTLATNCNHLTKVVLKDGIQDGKVLSAFGAYCPSLKVLDVTGSSIICTDVLYLIFPTITEAEYVSHYGTKSKKNGLLPNLPTGLKQSRLCSKLRQLIVSDTKMRSLGVYYALKYLPNLESLGVCYYIGSGIKKHWIEGWTSFNLKEVHAWAISKEKINLVCSACPNLETLYIGTEGYHPFTFKLQNLSKVSCLKSLTLESPSSLDLRELKYARQLADLTLQVPDVDVGQIADSCPLLQRLIITKEPKKTFTLSNDDRIKFHTLKPFGCLQELQVDTPMSVKVAGLIMTEATVLRTVKVVRVKKLSDNILAAWLDKNPFPFLETLVLTYAHLTVSSVELLLKRCPMLSTLGRLSGWDVRSWETRRLERTWQEYDINLILFSHKQEDVAQIMDATASSDEEED